MRARAADFDLPEDCVRTARVRHAERVRHRRGLAVSRYRTVGAEARFADNLVARLRALPSVRAASTSASWPFQANGLTPIDVAGVTTAPDRAPQAFTFIVGTRFFDSLGIRIVRGRDFTDADGPRSLAVAVVNEAMARRAFAGDDGSRTAASRDAIRRVGPQSADALGRSACARSRIVRGELRAGPLRLRHRSERHIAV